MNIREAHREIWKKKLVPGIQPPSEQCIDRVIWVAELLPTVVEGVLVDFGTGSGAMLARAAAKGYKSTGLDFDAPVVDWLEGQGYDARCLDISSERLPFCDESVDVVTCCDVIEHLVDPLQAIREAKRILRSSGLLFIATANYTFWKRIVDLAAGFHRGTSSDNSLLDGGHVSYWGATDLSDMLSRLGFADVRVEFRNPNPAPDDVAEVLMLWAKDRNWIDHTYQIGSGRKP
jgi:SAM-dependent methyltransferase